MHKEVSIEDIIGSFIIKKKQIKSISSVQVDEALKMVRAEGASLRIDVSSDAMSRIGYLGFELHEKEIRISDNELIVHRFTKSYYSKDDDIRTLLDQIINDIK